MDTTFDQFKEDLRAYSKELVTKDQFKSLSVAWGYSIENRTPDSTWFYVTSNASLSLSGSFGYANEMRKYIESHTKLHNAIDNNKRVHIDIKFSEKKGIQSLPSNKKDDKESKAISFFPINPKYSFEQIILPDNIRKEIMSAMKVVQCKDLIYEKWGFGKIEPSPKSIINMYGDPGTGKTMCAHAIANYLGKRLLALNYAEIESKYVGEAPKNLMAAFNTAKEQDCVIFFDEADSFLGKRIQNVTSGSEQALNSLRSQMLILLEEFSGVVLFATNLVTNFDKAFESRILKHIKFELPNQDARVAIIKKHLPVNLPIDQAFSEDQFNQASEILDGFSGREIKGAILDMLLDKADINNPNTVFTFDDLCSTFNKKKEEKQRLKAEENKLLKEKIAKKLKEKAIESESEVETEKPSTQTDKIITNEQKE